MTSCRLNKTLSTGICDIGFTEERLAIFVRNRKWRASKKEHEDYKVLTSHISRVCNARRDYKISSRPISFL